VLGGELDEIGLFPQSKGGAVPSAGGKVLGGEKRIWVGEVVCVCGDARVLRGGGGYLGQIW
jgi:hypothetical protein